MKIPARNSEVQDVEVLSSMALAPVAKKQEVASSVEQSKIDSINSLLSKAYEKASTLELTPEESAKLTCDFEDADFRRGAGGDNNMIYLEYSAIKKRLNEVLGLGKWAFIVSRSWNEEYLTAKKEKAVRVYSEGVLLVRGCYVGSAIGDMSYFLSNAKTSYGDAYEGSKTSAFRRAVKDWGVGVQCYSKEWCDGWLSRYPGFDKPERKAKA